MFFIVIIGLQNRIGTHSERQKTAKEAAEKMQPLQHFAVIKTQTFPVDGERHFCEQHHLTGSRRVVALSMRPLNTLSSLMVLLAPGSPGPPPATFPSWRCTMSE